MRLLIALLLALPFAAHTQERVAQDPHDSLRNANQAKLNDIPVACVTNTQKAAAQICPIRCQIRVPDKALSKADSCDTRLWKCEWPKQAASKMEDCPAGWSGHIYKDQIYEVQNCGTHLEDTGKFTVSSTTCVRGRTEVSQTACPTGGEWTGSGITKTRTVNESLNTDLSTTTFISATPWSMPSVECTRTIRQDDYTQCPIGSGPACLNQFYQGSGKLISSTCPNAQPLANANVYSRYITQKLGDDLTSVLTLAKSDPTPISLACPPINGVCGSTTNGQSLTQAPVGNALCQAGTPSAVSGNGPWNWTCNGISGGTGTSCSAQSSVKSCPVAVVTVEPLAEAVNITYPGITNDSYYFTTGDFFDGMLYQGMSPIGPYNYISNCGVNATALCVGTTVAQQYLSGYSNCKASSATSSIASPLKVSLANKDALMNSTQETSFTLTLRDNRILQSTVTGGLNPDEGWLMVHRSAGGLLKEGMLNADNWFGDRDHRSLNAYTDLAETFAKFLEQDEYGQRYLPLKKLTDKEKKSKLTPGIFTNPSFDLRILDAQGKEHFASDFFTRIYVDYTNVMEGDAPDGVNGKNLILERGIVKTVQDEFHGAVDQWFVLDISADYSTPTTPGRTRVLPAPNSPTIP